MPTPLSLAAEALSLAEVNPSRALALAQQAEGAPSLDAEELLARGVAAWARGRACRHLGRYRQAQAALEAAVQTLSRSGDRLSLAKASLHLALELIDAGRFDEAVDLIDGVAGDLTGTDAARAAGQRALALQRGGRTMDALEDWDRAMAAFASAGMEVDAAICLESRGLVRAYRGELGAAEADLVAAERVFLRRGEEIRAVEAAHNRGFVAARRGDLPLALALFDEAQSRAAALGVLRPAMLVDRVEVCLQAGLNSEAKDLAEAAVEQLEKAGLGADVPEACLLAARACEHYGDPAASASWAKQAVRLFGDQRRPRWQLLARYAAERADAAALPATPDLAHRLATTAQDLRRGGWATPAIEAQVRAAEVLVNSGLLAEARELVDDMLRGSRGALPLTRLQVRLCQARLYWAAGGGAAADRALTSGLRALAAHQATLGSIELRAAGGGQAAQVMSLGVSIARGRNAPSRAFWWMEAVRSVQESGPIHRQEGPEIETALQELRQVTARQAEEHLAPHEITALRRRQAALEEVVRRLSRHAAGARPAAPTLRASGLAQALGDRLLVEYGAVDGRLVAVVVSRGKCRLVDIGDQSEAQRAVAYLRLALQEAIRGTGSGGDAVRKVAQKAEDLLIRPLELPAANEVVIVPDPVVASTPWGALPLLSNAAVVVAPSAEAAARGSPSGARRRGILVVVGPGLRHGGDEAAAVKAAWGGRPRVLQGGLARLSAARPAMAEAALVHIVAHGSFRSGNALLSTVRLEDGPVTADELAVALEGASLVVLSCCDSAMVDPNGLGLSRLLHRAGTGAIVASVTPVPDASTASLMGALHHQMSVGLSPAAALAAARLERGDFASYASSAAFICFGNGFGRATP